MAISTAQIPDLLLPGLRRLSGEYQTRETQWGPVFARHTSQMQYERTVAMRYTPLAGIKPQGMPTNVDNLSGQRWVYTAYHIGFGLGYTFTHEAIADNLYKSQFNASNLGLMRSFKVTKEIVAADVLNTGNVWNAQIGGDGVALFSTAHPVDGGTVPNMPSTQLGLNEATLLQANNMIRRFRFNEGFLMSAKASLLIVPTELRHVAKRLIDTPLRTGTSNNDISAVKESQDLSSGYHVMDYLTSPTAWFVKSDIDGFIYLEREPFSTKMFVDDLTDNMTVTAYERYSMSYDDWRAGWGTYPTL